MLYHQIVMNTLELVAVAEVDISAGVYRRYFLKSPQSEDLMLYFDDLSRGRMMAEVLRLIMVEDLASEAAYLRFELKNHQQDYSVQAEMYAELFDAVHEEVRSVVAQQWVDEFDRAWRQKIIYLLTALNANMPKTSV